MSIADEPGADGVELIGSYVTAAQGSVYIGTLRPGETANIELNMETGASRLHSITPAPGWQGFVNRCAALIERFTRRD